jgi:chain length determinant protein EpsF
MTLQQLLLVLWARRRVAISVFVSIVALTLIVSLVLPRQYTATTALVIDAKVNDALLSSLPAAQGIMPAGFMATQIDIIGSDRVAQRVVALTRLDEIPQIREQFQDEPGNIRVLLGEFLRKQLDIAPSRESSVINISYTGTDPMFAAAIANAFAQAYMETNLELKVEPARQYAQWINDRSQGLRVELETAQRKLSEYEQANGIIAGDGRFDVENARLAELSSQLVAVEGQRADSHSRQSQVGSAESLPEVMNNGLISGLKADLVRYETQRGQLLERLGVNHPEVQRVDSEIGTLRSRIAAETQRVASSLGTTSRVSVARASEIADAVEKQKARVLELKIHRDQIAVLQRDVENAQRAYDLITQRFAQTSLESQQAQQTNIAVLTPAEPPTKHSRPRLLLNLIVAIFLGGMLGMGLALALELVDQRVHGDQDLRQLEGIPVLGVIPASNTRNSTRRSLRRLASAA